MTDAAARGGFAALDPCVHCGFCLPACPTYLATGDENDSPRGRIVLMRALEAGQVAPSDPALRQHLDACLGCRGCEPACPSGVGYGQALEAARARMAAANGLPWSVRGMLAVFRHEYLWRPLLTAARWLAATGIPGRLAGWNRPGFGMGMLAATRTAGAGPPVAPGPARMPEMAAPKAGHPAPVVHRRVALYRGCVMDTLFADLNRATRRVLEACGHSVVEVPGQACCGALHAHAGDLDGARALAQQNIAAVQAAGVDLLVVNSAGCGALLREYAHLVPGPAAEDVAARVRDVTEVLAESPLPPLRPLNLDIVYDPPCHLQHAQGVHEAPLAVLRRLPGARVRLLPGAERCCGGAGAYTVFYPALSHQVLRDKLGPLRHADPPPQVLVTGNPGCLMQIGAGIRAEGLPVRVAHPVEVVAWALEGGVRGKR